MSGALQGKCLCGSVEISATLNEEQMDACHCNMCRTWSGGPFLAFACGSNVSFSNDDSLSVYKSSEWAERVFCKNCGTALAWRLQAGGEYHVSSQLFAEADDYPLKMQVFIDEKPDNYSFSQETATMTAAQIFALFADQENGAEA